MDPIDSQVGVGGHWHRLGSRILGQRNLERDLFGVAVLPVFPCRPLSESELDGLTRSRIVHKSEFYPVWHADSDPGRRREPDDCHSKKRPPPPPLRGVETRPRERGLGGGTGGIMMGEAWGRDKHTPKRWSLLINNTLHCMAWQVQAPVRAGNSASVQVHCPGAYPGPSESRAGYKP